MEVNAQQIESIVRELLGQLGTAEPAKKDCSCGSCTCGKNETAGSIPKTARVAMLMKPRDIQVKEYPIPPVGDNDILVKVEGCGVCGTDVHEWKGDPFGMAPLVLGHEGTGTIVAMGKNIHCDTAGKPLKVGDKIVTSVTKCGECYTCRMLPEKSNLCDKQGIFGLIPDSEDQHLNGWFSEYLMISREGATYFEVNDLDLYERMLLEVACVCVHALERGQSTGLLHFNSKVLVQGCGPVGLMMIAVLRAAGINHVIAVDGSAKRLDMAVKLGAKTTINFKEMPDAADRVAEVKKVANGVGADFAYQCTGAPAAHAGIYDYIRRGGGLCEMGFFVNNGECAINPHFAYCNKEITLVGSWDYTAQDYPVTMAFMKQAREMNIPLKELVTHTYPLDKLNEAMETNISQQGIKICYIAE